MKSFVINYLGDRSGEGENASVTDGITVKGMCSSDSSVPLTNVKNFVYIAIESLRPSAEEGFEPLIWETGDNGTLTAEVVSGDGSPDGKTYVYIHFAQGGGA